MGRVSDGGSVSQMQEVDGELTRARAALGAKEALALAICIFGLFSLCAAPPGILLAAVLLMSMQGSLARSRLKVERLESRAAKRAKSEEDDTAAQRRAIDALPRAARYRLPP